MFSGPNASGYRYRFIPTAKNEITIDTSASPRRLLRNSTGSASGDITERHLETTNALYVDGHVKAQKLDALIAVNNGIPTVLSIELD
jgi:prepilin-type processing-associated H-X9-DG protein